MTFLPKLLGIQPNEMEEFLRESPKYPNVNFSILQVFSKEDENGTIRDSLLTVRKR